MIQSDPERRAKYNKQVSESIMKRYNTDEAFREELKRKRRERYWKQKTLLNANNIAEVSHHTHGSLEVPTYSCNTSSNGHANMGH